MDAMRTAAWPHHRAQHGEREGAAMSQNNSNASPHTRSFLKATLVVVGTWCAVFAAVCMYLVTCALLDAAHTTCAQEQPEQKATKGVQL